jgi:hypothetical protein
LQPVHSDSQERHAVGLTEVRAISSVDLSAECLMHRQRFFRQSIFAGNKYHSPTSIYKDVSRKQLIWESLYPLSYSIDSSISL